MTLIDIIRYDGKHLLDAGAVGQQKIHELAIRVKHLEKELLAIDGADINISTTGNLTAYMMPDDLKKRFNQCFEGWYLFPSR